MADIFGKKYKLIFLETASDFLKKLQKVVVILLNDPDNTAVVEDAYLASHSVKSECARMHYTDIANFFLLLEMMFKARREGKFTFSHQVLILIHEELENIVTILPHMVNENKSYDVNPAYQKLQG